jgi:Methyltransferase domain
VFSTKFNFIHGRALLSCFQNPAAVLRQAFDALTPGGYLEMQDGIFPMKYVGEPPVDSDLYKWNELVAEGARRSGRPWNNTLHYAEWMREIGFEDVVEKNFYWPTSPWAKGEYFKQVAIYFQEDMLNGLEGISMKVLTRFMGWTAEEVKALLVGVKRDFKDRSIHAYLSM